MRFLKILNLLLLIAALSGCWGLGVSKGIAPGQLGDADLLNSLIGHKSEEAIRELGLPDELMSDGEKQFMMYSARSKGTDMLVIGWIPIPVATAPSDILHCLRVELDSDNLVKDYRVKSKSVNYQLPGGFSKNAEIIISRKNCRKMFWYRREMEKLEMTRVAPREWFEIVRLKEGEINQPWWWNLEYQLRRQAEQGNSEAQLNIFKNLSKKQPEVALVWLCRSADSGNQEARVILKNIYEHGGDPWIEKGIVERDFRLAYVWHELSGVELYSSQAYLDYIASEKGQDAIKMLRDWQPGNCERDLGLDGDELIKIN